VVEAVAARRPRPRNSASAEWGGHRAHIPIFFQSVVRVLAVNGAVSRPLSIFFLNTSFPFFCALWQCLGAESGKPSNFKPKLL